MSLLKPGVIKQPKPKPNHLIQRDILTLFLFCLIIHPLLTPETMLAHSDKRNCRHHNHHLCQKQHMLLQMASCQTECVGGNTGPFICIVHSSTVIPPETYILVLIDVKRRILIVIGVCLYHLQHDTYMCGRANRN